MKAKDYCKILNNNMFESAAMLGHGDSFVFQQDNDPKHTAGITKDFFEEKELIVVDWPFQSPDMNPIKNLWHYLKIRVVDGRSKNLSKLKQYVVEE